MNGIAQMPCWLPKGECVVPDVNLRNPLRPGDETCIHSGFDTQDKHHEKLKQGQQFPREKELCLPKLKQIF